MAEVRPIDANALLEVYKKWLPQLTAEKDAGDRNGVETCIAVLEDETTLDYAPVRHGEWICPDCDFSDYWKCSACNEDFYFEYDPVKEGICHYCPNCGAKMGD